MCCSLLLNVNLLMFLILDIQVVDLESNGLDCLDLPPEEKNEILSALKEAPSLHFMDASSRHTISHIVL